MDCFNCGKKINSTKSSRKFCDQACYHLGRLKEARKKSYNIGSSNSSWRNLPISSKEVLYADYVEHRMSIRKIAKKYSISIRSVARWLEAHRIKTRDSSASIKISFEQGRKTNKKESQYCIVCNKKFPKRCRTKRCMKCYSKTLKGSGNPRYTGIADIKTLVRQWCYDHWRPKIFSRDEYTCIGCGDSRGGNLEAHHIVPLSKILKKICAENDISTPKKRLSVAAVAINHPEITSLENGETLCKTCHSKKHKKHEKTKVLSIRCRMPSGD